MIVVEDVAQQKDEVKDLYNASQVYFIQSLRVFMSVDESICTLSPSCSYSPIIAFASHL